MSRKALIICLSALAILAAAIIVAVTMLYPERNDVTNTPVVQDSDSNLLLPAVPTDAMFICDFENPDKFAASILSENEFASEVAALAASDLASTLRMTVSLHFLGSVEALYIFDVGPAREHESSLAQSIRSIAEKNNMHAAYLDCSSLNVDRRIAQRSILLASSAKELVLSSIRHLKASESIINMPGFANATDQLDGGNRVFVSNMHFHKLYTASLQSSLRRHSSFLKRLSNWVVFDFADFSSARTLFSGKFVSDSKDPDILSIFGTSGVSLSKVSVMLPSYTVSAMTIPLGNRTEYIDSYQNYLDSKQALQRKLILQNKLQDTTGVAPEDFYNLLDIQEIATVSFKVDNELERVNLMKINNQDPQILFAGTGVSAINDYSPRVHPFKYENYAASVFGDLFILHDESCFTYLDGWVISGSKSAVEEYTSGRALSYNLKEYMENAGLQDKFSSVASSFMAYLSLTAEPQMLKKLFNENVFKALSRTCEGVDYSGVFLSVGENAEPEDINIEVFRNEIRRSKAPSEPRDVEIYVSKGPFDVMNSHTGKMNQFYQRTDNNFLCLRDETGKNVWGAPFAEPICGSAQTIDFYKNNKLQILFAAGSRLYLIDRLGRLVQDCSTDLKKQILLGPSVFDFAGNKDYEVMVLHNDNTIEMYDLKGGKSSEWTTIEPPQKVTCLPERLDVSGKVFWVVRTSVQTLIYPFKGGLPLTTFEGDQMILPDSKVLVVDQATVEAESYDGKKRKIQLF